MHITATGESYSNSSNVTVTAGNPDPYTIRLARISGITASIEETIIYGSGTTTETTEVIAGTTPTDLTEVFLGGTRRTAHFGNLDCVQMYGDITGATVYEVLGGTFTGNKTVLYDTDATINFAEARYKTKAKIVQIHHGDVYVDGRWS